jgi:hypothetical protein
LYVRERLADPKKTGDLLGGKDVRDHHHSRGDGKRSMKASAPISSPRRTTDRKPHDHRKLQPPRRPRRAHTGGREGLGRG